MQLLHNNTSTTSGTSAFACVYSAFACVWYFCICTCMHNYISNTWWLWLLVAAFCAWDSKQPLVYWLPPMALDKMFHVQWATISNIQACLFQGDVDGWSFMYRKTVYWYRLMAMPCSYKQRCTDGFRCAWRLSCSPWTWIFVSIAEMVALPCVSVTLCEHIIMLMHYVFGKLHFKSCLVTFVMWWVVLNQVSTQICNVQIFGEVVYYFSMSTIISMASLASFQMGSCSFLWLLQSVDLVITTHRSSLASMTFSSYSTNCFQYWHANTESDWCCGAEVAWLAELVVMKCGRCLRISWLFSQVKVPRAWYRWWYEYVVHSMADTLLVPNVVPKQHTVADLEFWKGGN